jgi:hypothetical protein
MKLNRKLGSILLLVALALAAPAAAPLTPTPTPARQLEFVEFYSPM